LAIARVVVREVSDMLSNKSTELGIVVTLMGAMFLGTEACSSSLNDPPDGRDGTPLGGNASGNGSGTDFGDSFSAADGTGAGFDGNGACAGETAGAEVSPTVLQLIVDTSGSMDDDAPGSVRGSKWEATRSALLSAVDRMPATTAVGVVFYPDVDNGNDDNNQNACFDRQTDVPLQVLNDPGSQQRVQIQQAFQNQKPRGGTPTHDAYAFAVQGLEAVNLPGTRFAVLITDGIPTFSLGCDDSGRGADNAVDSTPLVAEAARSLSRDVRTFVIGSPGSEGARESLSRMAEAGGTATPGCSHNGPTYCHFDMTGTQDFASALADALGQIAGLALSCSYNLPSPPNGGQLDPAKVNVLFRPSGGLDEVIAQSVNQRCSEGWQFSQDGSQVLLCGSTCDRVRDAEQGSLTLQFGCATTIR
jgi:von Willebrand factor type A domain